MQVHDLFYAPSAKERRCTALQTIATLERCLLGELIRIAIVDVDTEQMPHGGACTATLQEALRRARAAHSTHRYISGAAQSRGLAGLALQHKQRVTLFLLRSSSSVLNVAKVRSHHDVKLLRRDAKVGQVILQTRQTRVRISDRQIKNQRQVRRDNSQHKTPRSNSSPADQYP